VKGKLGDNMMPDMSTLTGNGNLLLIEGFLSKFAPLDKIAGTLNVKVLEQISLKDVRIILNSPTEKCWSSHLILKYPILIWRVGGLQGFDQSLDFIDEYEIATCIDG
jgi:hypothetical protein